MPRIPLPKFPDRLSQSFVVGDVSHLLGKMRSELNSFIENQGDVVISGRLALNIAMTAWHMVDWTFADMDAKQRRFVSKRFHRRLETPGDLAAAVTEVCSALRICQVIATAGKHVKVSTRPDPSLVTRLKLLEVETEGAVADIDAVWVIQRKGDEVLAADVFKEAHRFWEDLLSDLGMIEDPIMGRIDRGW